MDRATNYDLTDILDPMPIQNFARHSNVTDLGLVVRPEHVRIEFKRSTKIFVNLFNEEVLSLFITDAVFESLRYYLIDVHRKRLWGAVPAGLRYAYLRHRVKKQGAKHSLFAHLFIPVYESQLNKLGISESDRAARHEKLNRWTSYCMHEYWEETWLVAYWSSAAPAKVLPYYDNYTINDHPEKRIENDRKFLEILYAIDADDRGAVLEAFAGFHSSVDDLNYCFGTTILAFAAKHGSREMLTLLLRSVRRLTYKQLYKYLYIAITEARNPHATIDVFLNHLAQHFKDAKGNAFTSIDVARRLLTQNLLLAALARWDLLVLDAICKWIDSVPTFHGKLEMFKAIFARALPDQTLCALLPMLVTLATRNEKIPGLLAMSPTHHFGASYQQRLRITLPHHAKVEG
ncbi:hypothetical protein J4E80_006624 [Alternaria sp. BMP 0032]|nr:hypothetical protein J4E80_006624 [Alternaria sp. BMP 0032]